MRKRMQWLIAVGAIVLVLASLSVMTFAAQPNLKKAATVPTSMMWQITNARVISPSQVSAMPEGALSRGYTVEAKATAIGAAPFTKGQFRINLTAFSPSSDMPGQKAGRWYINGTWTITDSNASPKAAKARHSSAVIKGSLVTELLFDPSADQGTIDTSTKLPMSIIGDWWGKGMTTFSVNEKFEGTISLQFERWPGKGLGGK